MSLIAPVHFRELVEFSRRRSSRDRQAYILDVQGLPFGQFYVMPGKGATLAWSGFLDFDQLEQEILVNLAECVLGWSPEIERQERRSLTSVMMIVSEDLVIYDLADHNHYIEYQHALSEPTAVSFAQYDVREPSRQNTLGFSFRAENPQSFALQESELALLLPTNRLWSSSILAWVVRHHSMFESISEHEIDLIVQLLADLVSGTADREHSSNIHSEQAINDNGRQLDYNQSSILSTTI